MCGDFSWRLLLAGHPCEEPLDFLQLPQKLHTVQDVRKVIDNLNGLQLCAGNDDDRYFTIQAARKGTFKDHTG